MQRLFFGQFRINRPASVLQKYLHRLTEQSLGSQWKYPSFKPENIKGLDHSGDLGVYGRIILKWISNLVQESLLDETDSSEDPLEVSYKSNQGK
jgi:hypothetical protein